jgi:SAM-dependent methyltransferase
VSIKESLRQVARLAPAGLRADLKDGWNRVRAGHARRRFERAEPATRLDASQLPILSAGYPLTPVHYQYGAEDTLERGRTRCGILVPYVPIGGETLEIGSADGMTSCALAGVGRRATAIDIDTTRTDPRVAAAGVHVRRMDATRLEFPDAAFDLVYSFNVFEHLPDPAATFAEIARVLRPGGVAYIAFTGLRWSPHGGHLYKTIGIPYVTILFDEADVGAYLRSRGQSDWAPWVNDYSIERFRTVFESHGGSLDRLHYRETRNRWHTSLVAAHPGVFKRYAPSFESLIVDSVEVRFRRREEEAARA